MGPRKPMRKVVVEEEPPVVAEPAPDTAVSEGEELEQEYHTEASDASAPGDDEVEVEPEYHTEESGDEDAVGRQDVDVAPTGQAAPYLPEHLLKAPRGPTISDLQVVGIRLEDMTRKQKQGQRRTNRQLKKRQWEKLKTDAKASGVLQAGKAAQLKRGILPMSSRVQNGRVTKKSQSKPKASGRQKLLEERKCLRGRTETCRPAKKTKAMSKG